jgi:hypothetical protein
MLAAGAENLKRKGCGYDPQPFWLNRSLVS